MVECPTMKVEVARWHHHIHQHPELSYMESETAAFIVGTLQSSRCPPLEVIHPVPISVVPGFGGGAAYQN
ncbi:putative Aminoacylase [Leptomonas seymouri]|uniref:Putative Aminoacylase n=1 Tax=Leptomonas seymouri TaxID=5684 RepID=A0A0N0P978_LEPSE|nr:putative Aminoacylase [Leptomonas seymouri]|eukprot:KPI90387.1 putative Aminoacylase [Leptomonas seymouri]